MAKKIAAEKVEPEVIAECDNLNEVTPNHDEVITSVAQSSPESVSIKSMIRLIRGQQVMLDSDLAFLYGVETRRLNEQVKRNIERFPDDFMFQLTKEEFDFLKSQFAMSNITDSQDIKNLKSQIAISRWGGTRKLPYAFTRNGVAMLSSVLRSQTAVGVNIKIMRAFAAIPQLVNNNAQMIQRIFNIEQHQQETDEKINAIIEKIENFSPKVISEQIFQTGCVWDAWSYLGYRIVQDPDRGADGKKDMIVDEVIKGITSEYTIRWLVSCKHYAHSGVAVKDSDEINISDRLKQHHCDGFMGVYSTLASTSLSGVLQGQEHSIIFDHEKIESYLLENLEGHRIAYRYFPISFRQYQIENPTPAKIFDEEAELCCDYCGKNLLLESEHGNYVLLKEEDSESGGYKKQYKDLYFACRGDCDQTLRRAFQEKGLSDFGWESIDELCNPAIWISKIMAFLNGIQQEQDMDNVAFEKMKRIFINTYPYVARHLTQKEKMRKKKLLMYGLM